MDNKKRNVQVESDGSRSAPFLSGRSYRRSRYV